MPSETLWCDFVLASPTVGGLTNHWKVCATTACLALIFGATASLILVIRCWGKTESSNPYSITRVGISLVTLTAGLLGAISVFLFFFVTSKDNLESTASSLMLLEGREWRTEISKFDFSFWMEALGSLLSTTAGLLLAYAVLD